MTRTILIPTNNTHNYYCFLPSNILVQLRKLSYFPLYKHVKFVPIEYNNIRQKILNIQPDAIFISITPSLKFNIPSIPIYYIHHGIFNTIKSYNWKKFNIPLLCCDTFQYKSHLMNNTLCKKINGLPQFDLVIHLKSYYEKWKNDFKIKYNISNNKVIILIISNHNYQNCNMFYNDLLESIIKKIPNAYIIFKTKHNYDLKINSKFKNKYTLKNGNTLIYNFLFADIIIVHEFGTSYPEALMINPKTILLDPNHKLDAPIIFKNIPELAKNINNIINDQPSSESINKYLDILFDQSTIPLISDKLLAMNF